MSLFFVKLEKKTKFILNKLLNSKIILCRFHFTAQTTRPKRLLLFVNPFGGKKRALQIYDCNVKPIFQIAGIDASVVISQRSNQIRDFIMTQSLEHFDGIVCIGGDGTFSEVFNGLIFRTVKDKGMSCRVSVGHHLIFQFSNFPRCRSRCR